MRHGGRRHEVKVGAKESCRWTKDGEGRARVGWRTEGPEETGRSHGWSTPGIIKGRHVETMGMASAKSRGARREVGHAFPSGLAVWASKTVQEAGFLVWASKPRSEGLSEAKRPTDMPRHVAELVWVVWASKPPRRRVSRFSPQ